LGRGVLLVEAQEVEGKEHSQESSFSRPEALGAEAVGFQVVL
jgi:hypothetical protein